jgi:Xaa-Pro aminopeptidase
MKADLDRLMQERNIDAFIILGTENEDQDRHYITNGVHASATVIKKRGSPPVLIAHAMEYDEAIKSGLQVYTPQEFDFARIIKETNGDIEAYQREYYGMILNKLDIRGRVAFYGTASVMGAFKFLNRFQRNFADRVELVEDEDINIFAVARRTKEPEEIAKLRESGQKSSLAMRKTRNWLSTLRAQGQLVADAEGRPVTIGDVKRFVRARLMEQGMEDNEGMIFAQGRDAGVPHSRGEEDKPLQIGQSIIFDLFPRPIGGGYYHDMTRTWCLGYAPPEVEEAHRLVQHTLIQAYESLTLGQKTRELQEIVCDIFEEHGHVTPKTDPGTTEGYSHSLGHGLGLDVHEAPNISNFTKDEVVFQAGDVVTIEPGLYYPSKGWGVRLEDTIYLDEKGEIHNLTDCPYDLVIPLNG